MPRNPLHPRHTKPWLDEPDELFFTSHGYPCMISRNPMQSLCGYVGIPSSHPLWNTPYNQSSPHLVSALSHLKSQPATEVTHLLTFDRMMARITGITKPTPSIIISVHGGLTWAAKYFPPNEKGENAPIYGKNARLWVFGFDCSHSEDYTPGLDKILQDMKLREETKKDPRTPEDFPHLPDEIAERLETWHDEHTYSQIYRDISYVRSECENLAEQLEMLSVPCSFRDFAHPPSPPDSQSPYPAFTTTPAVSDTPRTAP